MTTVAVSALLAVPAHAATTSIVASPSGTGTACTVAAPCSLVQAQQNARAAVAAGNGADVQLRGGEYTLTSTLSLTAADSGPSSASPVTYRAYSTEIPTLTSAKVLTGWQAIGGGLYTASTAGANFRQLYVDGVRATPARYPNAGAQVQIQGRDNTTKTLAIRADQAQAFAGNDVSQIEAVGTFAWGEVYLRVASATTSGSLTNIAFQNEEANIFFPRPFPPASVGDPLYFENARSFIDVPGEYSVDRQAGQIYYMPRAGESLTSRYTVPTLDTLVDVRGSSMQPVHDVRFDGIRFDTSNWTRPTTNGYLNAQGGLYNISANSQNQQYIGRPPAAVQVNWADRVSVTGSTFVRMGATALDLDTGVHDSSATGNVVSDVSGNGIMVGKFSDPSVEYHTPYNPSDLNEVTARVSVKNNVITGTGRVYYGTAGVNAGYIRDSFIEHNDISDSPWAGITTGWGWTTSATAQQNNSISYNRIANVVNRLCDTGAFYHLSNDPGTVVEGNYIHDVVRSPTACSYAVSGLYLDEGSSNMTLRNNVVSDVVTSVNQNRNGSGVVITNTVASDKAIIQNSGVEPSYLGLLQKVNVAAGKTTTASSEYGSANRSALAVDGDIGTGWSPTGTDTKAWLQVDLGSATRLGQVSLTTRQELSQPETRSGFEVRGSNDPSFSSYVVLAKRDGAQIPDAGTYQAKINDDGAYRYVRVAKTDGQYFYVTELSLQSSGGAVSSPAVPATADTARYVLTNANSGKALDVYGLSTADDARVVQWASNGGTNQQWYLKRTSGNLFSIVNVNSGKALDNKAAFTRGARVTQSTPNATSSQLWRIEARGSGYVIRNVASQQVLDVANGSTQDDVEITQWMDLTQNNQVWTLTPVN